MNTNYPSPAENWGKLADRVAGLARAGALPTWRLRLPLTVLPDGHPQDWVPRFEREWRFSVSKNCRQAFFFATMADKQANREVLRAVNRSEHAWHLVPPVIEREKPTRRSKNFPIGSILTDVDLEA